jgi:hypothetical protein
MSGAALPTRVSECTEACARNGAFWPLGPESADFFKIGSVAHVRRPGAPCTRTEANAAHAPDLILANRSHRNDTSPCGASLFGIPTHGSDFSENSMTWEGDARSCLDDRRQVLQYKLRLDPAVGRA